MITILLCSLPLAFCTSANALDVIRVVNRTSICPGMAAQAQLASTVLDRDLSPGEGVKIVCRR